MTLSSLQRIDSEFLINALGHFKDDDFAGMIAALRRIKDPNRAVTALIEQGQAKVLENVRSVASGCFLSAYELIRLHEVRISASIDRLALVQAWAGFYTEAVRTAMLLPEYRSSMLDGPPSRAVLTRTIAVIQWVMGGTGIWETMLQGKSASETVSFLKDVGEIIMHPRRVLEGYQHLQDLFMGDVGADLETRVNAEDLVPNWEALAMQCSVWDSGDRSRTIAHVRLETGDLAGAWAMAASMLDGEAKEHVLAMIALARFRRDELYSELERQWQSGRDTKELPVITKWQRGKDSVPSAEEIIKSLRESGGDDEMLASIVRNRMEAKDDPNVVACVLKMRDGDQKDSLVAAWILQYLAGETPNFPFMWQMVGYIKDISTKVRVIDTLASTMADWKYFQYLNRARELMEFAHTQGGLSEKARGVLKLIREMALSEMPGPEFLDSGILIVDDEPGVRKAWSLTLKRAGYWNLFEAEDGEKALEIMGIHSAAVHVVVTDSLMPLMGGLELVRHLAAGHPYPIEIVMDHGLQTEQDLQEFSRLGNDRVMTRNVLTKPVEPASMLYVIFWALRRVMEKRTCTEN